MTNNNNCPARVLQVLGGTGLGGAESRIMDLYRHIDRDKLQFDFLVHSDANPRQPQFYDEEIHSLGGNIYVLPRFRVYNYFSYRKSIKKFFDEHKEFSAVHGHMTSTAAIYLPIAKKSGVKVTLAHARSAGVDPGIKGKITNVLRKNLWKKADKCLACSTEAGYSAFGKKAMDKGIVEIFYNAIDVDRFVNPKLDSSNNPDIIDKNSIINNVDELSDNKFIIGHVGRFHVAKNHLFLVRVFARLLDEINKKEKELAKKDFRLLLVGDGELSNDVKKLAASFSLEDKIIFAGNQKDVEKYYQQMNIFCFPSIYEGMPGTVVEAQASGLKCLISDRITSEVVATDLVKQLPVIDCNGDLTSGYDADIYHKWAAEIIAAIKEKPIIDSAKYCEELKAKGFDVNTQAKHLYDLYKII